MRHLAFVETKTDNLDDRFISAGNRSYVVGSQNGNFPDFGHHVANEMGGVWNHPIKLLDGYWLRISETLADGTSTGFWLENADIFRNYAFHNEHEYNLKHEQLKVVRSQFCPDDVAGVVVRYTIQNEADTHRQFRLSFLARTDLSPVWFSENIGIEDGVDEGSLVPQAAAFLARDGKNPWFVAVTSDRTYTTADVDQGLFGPERTAGQGVTGQLHYDNVVIEAHQQAEILFFIAGSVISEEEVMQTLAQLKAAHGDLFAAKQERYETLLSHTDVNLPDKYLEKVFNWVKFNNDWLVQDVPGIGRGFVAGHPEYPWWFGCDNSYALKGMLALGDFQLAKDTLRLIAEVSEKTNGNGRVVHEITTFGAVSNPGNTQETPHFIACVWEVFRWTGDMQFLSEMYPLVKKGIQWLLEEMDKDGDLLPEGYGIIEIEGLNLELIDSAVYTYEALRVASEMAHIFDEEHLVTQYQNLSEQLGHRINHDLWLEQEGLYADAMGAPELILGRMDVYISRAREHGEERAAQELERMKADWEGFSGEGQRPWLFKNWVINTPMEVGLAPRDKAIRALDRMGTEEFTGPWGTYLSGLYRSHMMTISTGVQAVAECQYGRIDEGLRYVNLIASTFNKRLPGSISEMSPDYGCFVQAWTVYGMVWPLIVYMFGIKPRSHEKTVTLTPQLPTDWNEASVKRVRLGTGVNSNEMNICVQLLPDVHRYLVEVKETGWAIELELPDSQYQRILVNGEKYCPSEESGRGIPFRGSGRFIIEANL